MYYATLWKVFHIMTFEHMFAMLEYLDEICLEEGGGKEFFIEMRRGRKKWWRESELYHLYFSWHMKQQAF